MVTTKDVAETFFGGEEPVYGGEALPKGRYVLTVVEAEPRTKEDSGNWRVHYQAKVAEGDFTNRVVFDDLFLNTLKADGTKSKARGMALAMLLTMLGDIPAEVSSISPYDQEGAARAIAQAIVGAVFEADATIETDKSGMYPPRNRLQPIKQRE